MYKDDLALNSLQRFYPIKPNPTQPNQTKLSSWNEWKYLFLLINALDIY